jgi:hypothetical protein
MPNAKRTYERFWLSSDPHQPELLNSNGPDMSGWRTDRACPVP